MIRREARAALVVAAAGDQSKTVDLEEPVRVERQRAAAEAWSQLAAWLARAVWSRQGGVGGTPPAISGAGTFFSGADITVTKLVAGDALPGYFYVSANAPKGIIVEAVTDAALPAGTKYAITAELDTTLPDNFIFGWNWRQDTAEKKWNFADISAYAGVSF